MELAVPPSFAEIIHQAREDRAAGEITTAQFEPTKASPIKRKVKRNKKTKLTEKIKKKALAKAQEVEKTKSKNTKRLVEECLRNKVNVKLNHLDLSVL